MKITDYKLENNGELKMFGASGGVIDNGKTYVREMSLAEQQISSHFSCS